LGGATLGILKGRGSLQDIDQQGLFGGMVKWQVSISRVADIVPLLEKAFRIARSGVPGPVFVELPLDLLYPEDVIREQLLSKMSSGGTKNNKQKRTSIFKKMEILYIRYYLYRLFGKASTEPHYESAPLSTGCVMQSNQQPSSKSFLVFVELPTTGDCGRFTGYDGSVTSRSGRLGTTNTRTARLLGRHGTGMPGFQLRFAHAPRSFQGVETSRCRLAPGSIVRFSYAVWHGVLVENNLGERQSGFARVVPEPPTYLAHPFQRSGFFGPACKCLERQKY